MSNSGVFMSKLFRTLLLGALFVSVIGLRPLLAQQDESPKRIFMYIAQPSSEAWQFLLNNPQDRRKVTAAALEKIDVELLSYYFGLGNGRLYITVAVPDGVTAQAMVIIKLATPQLDEYEAIELVASEDMSAVLAKARELIKVEKQYIEQQNSE